MPPLSVIQNDILYRLKYAPHLRYRDLHESTVPNDLFNYHLQYLVRKGLVEKRLRGYSLSAVGAKHVADPLRSSDPMTNLFKLNVITILSRVNNGRIEILNQRRSSNPSFGKVGVMGGVVRKGESLVAAASRKLEQETGLRATFKIVGCERRIMYKASELFSDVVFPLAYASKYSGVLIAETKFGENFWTPIAQAINNESAVFDSIPGIATVLKAVRNGSIDALPFFYRENTQRDK
jgi:8-oxo-dGTP pyrophosphatase MutT (NUDIX family)